MLGIHGVGRDRADYYLSDLARELPVSDPGRWVGAAAERLGLHGAVTPEGLGHLLGGRNPRSGQPVGSGRVSVTAFDLTFSAPKSASVLFALGGEAAARQVVAAHADAVAGALEVPREARRHRRSWISGCTRRNPDHGDRRGAVHPLGQPER